MDAAVLTVAQLISNVIGSVKNARDLATATNNSELRDQIAQAFDGLLDLREKLLDLDEENRGLKADLTKKAEIEGPVPPFGYFYKTGDREHPLCPKCWQSKEPREAFMGPLESWNRGTRRCCRICGHQIYEKEMDLTPRPVAQRGRYTWS